MRQLIISKSITKRESMSLDKYLSEICKIKLLSSEEEVALAQRIRNNDREAITKLTAANLRFVVSVAKQYQNQGMNLSDLINEGNIGLIKAVHKFDETRGFKFISYAVWWIRQSIMQALREYSKAVKMPANQSTAIRKCNTIMKAFEQKHQRVATLEEVAEIMCIPREKLNETMQNTLSQISFDQPLENNTESGIFLDIFENKDAIQGDCNLIAQSLRDDVQRVFKGLSERERDILSLCFGIGFNEETPINSIGDKFNLSGERVRQIREKALTSIRNSQSQNLLRPYLG